MALPVCAEDCEDLLPAVLFSDCAPETNVAEVEWLYIAKPGYIFPATLAAMVTALAANNVRKLRVVGSKPKPTGEAKQISGDRKAQGTKSHLLPFRIDETNPTNHEFLRSNECGGNYQFIYETAGGKLFGGTEGMLAYMALDMVIAESREDFMVYDGSMSWKNKFTEPMSVSLFN